MWLTYSPVAPASESYGKWISVSRIPCICNVLFDLEHKCYWLPMQGEGQQNTYLVVKTVDIFTLLSQQKEQEPK